MKKIFILALSLTALTACARNPAPEFSSASSSEEESSASSFGEEESLSHESEESGKSLVDLVSQEAAKYNGTTYKPSELLEKSGLTADCKKSQGNLLILLQHAFQDVMPELKGSRAYEGYFQWPEISGALSPESNEALEWMRGYGLWGEDTYAPNKSVTIDFAKQVISRIHGYIGTNEKESFGVAMNYDFLFESGEEIGPNDTYSANNIIDTEAIRANTLSYMKEAKSENSDSAKALTKAIDLFVNKAEGLCGAEPIITFLDQPTTAEEWWDKSVKCISDYGFSPLLCPTYAYETRAGNTLYFDAYQPQISSAQFKKALKAMNLSESRASDLSKGYNDFSSEMKTHLFRDGGVYDHFSLDKNEFTVLNFDYRDVFEAAGLSAEKNFVYSRATVKTYRDLCAEGKIESLKAATIANFVEEFSPLFADALSDARTLDGAKNPKSAADVYDFYPTYINNETLCYYAGTKEYKTLTSTINSFFHSLIDTYVERLPGKEWLDDASRANLEKKMRATAPVIGLNADGKEFPIGDYMAKAEEFTSLSAYIAAHNRSKLAILAELMSENSDSHGLGLLSAYVTNLLEPNCFNIPYLNAVILTAGFLLSRPCESDLENIIALYGLVLSHEISHSVDTSGVMYDYKGEIVNNSILSSQAYSYFAAQAEIVAAHYSEFEAMPGILTNGDLVVSEAVADSCGLALTMDLAAKKEDFDYKRCFTTLAKNFMSKATRSTYLDQCLDDVHPWGAARVDALFSNCPEFIKTYELDETNMMYRCPEQIVEIW